ncbi:MAG TPA: anti-sigma factor [Gemmataceae bacterium]|jgi:anti-sigma factor RsiW|nr:anti-sigma factor [Gemmataceae bacterium]
MHELLHAYFDNELAEPDRAAFEEHLAQCPDCTREMEAQTELRLALQDKKMRFQPPANLAGQIKASLRHSRRLPAPWQRGVTWLAAASVLIGIGLAGTGLLLTLRAPTAEDRLAQETTANHARALQANHLLDVASTNRHKVKPWFQGKLDFAPPVVDLAEQGYPLAGGRLDYVDARPAAALVYHRRDHVINLFIWPRTIEGDAAITTTLRRGYSVVHWSKDGLNFWAVSDLNAEELRDFAGLVQKETP